MRNAIDHRREAFGRPGHRPGTRRACGKTRRLHPGRRRPGHLGAGPPRRPGRARRIPGPRLGQVEPGHAAHRPDARLAMEGQPGEGRGPAVQDRRGTDAPRRHRLIGQRVRPRPRGRGHLPQDRRACRGLQADATPVGREPGGGRDPSRPRIHEGRDGLPGTRRRGDDPRAGRLAHRHERLTRIQPRLQREVHRRPRADAHARHDR